MIMYVIFIVVKRLHRIGLILVWAVIAFTPTLYVYGQTQTKHLNKASIGFRAGTSVWINPAERNNTTSYAVRNGIAITKPISTHFRAEALINLNIFQNQCCIDKILKGNPREYLTSAKMTLPVTMQYFPLRPKNKVQPYIAAGVQYNPSELSNTTQANNNDYPAKSANLTGTKYISIIFTQGVTYKVSTDIQIIQSFHFIPGNERQIGIDLGIGYTIP